MNPDHTPRWRRWHGYAETVDGAEPSTRDQGRRDLRDTPTPARPATVDTTGDDTPAHITGAELADAWANLADRRAVGLTFADGPQFWSTFHAFRQGVSRALDEYAHRQFEEWAWPQIQQWTGAPR